MSKLKLIVLSHKMFDDKMRELNINDNNVEETNMAFISIIGTKECLEYYLNEGNTKHYFKEHPNVLNLDFDDIGTDVIYNGHLFKTMRIEQAEETINFIEKNIQNGVYAMCIHCRAGVSRSRAFAEFIYRYCLDNDIDVEYEDRNNYTMALNHGILRKLNHAYWKKNKLYMYENDEEYSDDIINPPIKVINRE